MESIIIHPKSKKQREALQNFLEAFNIPFEPSPYDPEFVAKIKESEQQIRDGKSTRIKTKEELKAFLNAL